MNDTTITAGDLTFAEFPPASRDQWLALVSGVLKGASFEQRLVSRTYDGIAIAPLYARGPAAWIPPGRTAGTPWQIVQRIELPDAAAANAQALHDLENGATALALVFAGAIGAHGFGLRSDDAVARVLDGVVLDAGVAIDLQAGPQTADVARQVTEVVARRGVSPAAADVAFGFDPLGDLAAGAPAAPPWREGDFAGVIRELAAQGYRGPFAVADGRVIHNAGGSEAQELAYVLATALTYLRALEARGVACGVARRMLCFRLAADADQLLTTAKFRALRKLWARVEDACGLPPAPASVAAEIAWRMMTRRDPFVNMLRATVAAVAAGLGGADSITVLPHTAAIGLPDGFARRIARNTQLILLEESDLAKVADPAAGAGGLESLTHELCVAAWSLFQEIEKAGGAAAALEQGMIQARVAAVRDEREKAVALRRDALTGTSEFPDIAEAPAAVLTPSPLVPGTAGVPPALRADQKEDGGTPAVAAALPCRRLAEPFEALRDASDRFLEKTGARPKIFLANLGRLADFTARATFAKNLFEAGGIMAVTSDGFGSRDEMLAAFKASGARLACLCASDEVYAAEAVGAAEALCAAGATHVYLAGRPGELEAALTAAGVGTFIYIGCDVVATLTAAHDVLRST
jgi:methylmalonyl-CoA mutase